MGRWIAIGKATGWDDFDAFRAALHATSDWRIDRKSSVTSVYAVAGGQVVAECHAPDRAVLEAWMAKKGIVPDTIHEISFVAKTGETWKV